MRVARKERTGKKLKMLLAAFWLLKRWETTGRTFRMLGWCYESGQWVCLPVSPELMATQMFLLTNKNCFIEFYAYPALGFWLFQVSQVDTHQKVWTLLSSSNSSDRQTACNGSNLWCRCINLIWFLRIYFPLEVLKLNMIQYVVYLNWFDIFHIKFLIFDHPGFHSDYLGFPCSFPCARRAPAVSAEIGWRQGSERWMVSSRYVCWFELIILVWQIGGRSWILV